MTVSEIQTLLEQSCRAASTADVEDPGALAQLHGLLERMQSLLSGTASEQVGEAAKSTLQLIMRETENAHSALGGIQSILSDLQSDLSKVNAPSLQPQGVDRELLAAWGLQVGDACDELSGAALRLAKNHDDAEAEGEVRRRIHTLKGEFGVLGLEPGRELCHRLEERLVAGESHRFVDAVLCIADWVRAYAALAVADPGATPPDGSAVELRLQEACDEREAASHPPAAAASDDAPVDLTIDAEHQKNLAIYVNELKDHVAAAERELLAIESGGDPRQHVEALFRAFHTVKGVGGFLGLRPVVEVSHATETLFDEVRKGRLEVGPGVIEAGLGACDALVSVLNALTGGDAPTYGRIAAISGRLLDCINPENASKAPTTAPASVALPAPETAPVATAGAVAPKVARSAQGETTVKVATTRMDRLIDLVGELVIASQMVVQDPRILTLQDQRVQRNITHVSKIVRDLQQTSMALRLVTIKATFQKMARVARDVAHKAGRQIEFRTEGEETELDRTIVDLLNDPLVHIIRNSCDHGIEPPEDRIAKGKSPKGIVTLRAYHQGGAIVVEVCDDGKGLDRQRILRKAIERGLIPADRDVSSLTDAECHNLIFLPGFSTAEQITDISGRGVGMDVVRKSIEDLRGKVEIRSEFGKGTTILMRLPLTMAIIDGMVIRVGSNRYIIPTLNIERSYQPRANDIFTAQGGRGEMARVRDALLPIHRLNRVLGLEGGCQTLTEGLLLVVDAGSSRCCVFVDEILGQQQVVIKGLGGAAPRVPGVSGGAIMGDGRVALILDIAAVAQLATDIGATPATGAEAA
jgi:two-component system chemotaxis sensor kinase CheA